MTTVTNNRVGRSVVRVGRSVVDKFGKGSLKDSSLSTKSFAVALRAILTSMLFLFFWGGGVEMQHKQIMERENKQIKRSGNCVA